MREFGFFEGEMGEMGEMSQITWKFMIRNKCNNAIAYTYSQILISSISSTPIL